MAELTIKQKREWAEMLFLKEHLTQGEIAEKVGTSRQSINKWARDGKWDERRAALSLTRESQIEQLYQQVAEINNTIRKRPEGERYASPSESDSLNKLASAIKKMEVDAGISDLISAGTRFINWLRPVDLEKAKELTRLWDAFIRDSL
jgi:Putative transcription regulator (DUF1323).